MKMVKTYLKLIFCLVFLFITYYYRTLSQGELSVVTLDNPSPGYLFMAPPLSDIFYLVDNSGEPIYNKIWDNFGAISNPNLQGDGLVSFFMGNKFYIMNKDYEVVDSFSFVGNYGVDFHDFLLVPNGNAILIGRETRLMDLSKSVPGGNKNAVVIGNIIQELDMNKNVVFQWSSIDHFQITDVTNDVDLKQPSIISCSMNSIFYDTDSNIIISSRFLDEITKIDVKTGNIIWRLGGKECKNNQFRYLNDTIDGFYGFSHQHSVRRLPNGNLILFDNGNLKPKPYSRAVEYKLNEKNKTIEKVWEYSPFPEILSQSQGSVQRLSNGNTMIGWGLNTSNITATEVKPDGTKALEIESYLDYTLYSVNKYIYKMHAVTIDIDKTGSYDFNIDTNETNVKIIINSLTGTGNISVAMHFYQPHNLEFPSQLNPEIVKTRWVVSKNGINNLEATIRFYISYDTTNNLNNYFIFYREHEGKGIFSQLETSYNQIEKCFEADIKGTGEFIIGLIPSVLAPVALYPLDSAKDVDINITLTWQPLSVASKYSIQLSYYSDFSVLLIDSTDIINPWLDMNLNFDTTYYWRVKAFNADEHSPWSKTYLFATRPQNILSAPLLIYPPDQDTLVPVSGILEWENVQGVPFYNVEIALDRDFSIPVLNRFNIDTNKLSYNSLLPERLHYWRVSSSNGTQVSNWSPSWMFVTDRASYVDYENNRDDKLYIISMVDKLSLIVKNCEPGTYLLNLYDLRGNKVTESNANCDGNNDLIFNINNLCINAGFYFYRILSKDKTLTGKLLIQK